MLSQKVLSSLAVIALLAAPSYSSADVLWDQQPLGVPVGGIIDQDIPDLGQFSTYVVNDVVFNTDVKIDTVTTYFTNLNGAWGANVTQGILNIFNGDALMSTDDPTSGGDFGPGLVNVTITDLGNQILAITADISGLNLNLGAGTYWFGLSPQAGAGIPQEFHFDATSRLGEESQFRNPGGGFGLGTDWGPASILQPGYNDASITITGTPSIVPEPTTVGLLAVGLIGLVARRRR